MDAVVGRIEPKRSKVVGGQHDPIIKTMDALADQGTIAEGTLIAKDSDGKAIAHQKTSGVAMTGTVNGTNDDFTASLSPAPVLPGSVRIDNNNATPQVVVDDGSGRLRGDGTGTVDYETGAVAVAFTTPPESGKTVLIAHKTRPVGVVTQEIDTDVDDAALVIVHGAVNEELLLTRNVAAGVASDAVADAEDIAAIAGLGVHAL